MTMDAGNEKHEEITMRIIKRVAGPKARQRSLDSESKFKKKRKLALREHYYLAGNVFLLRRLYDRVPSPDS